MHQTLYNAIFNEQCFVACNSFVVVLECAKRSGDGAVIVERYQV